MKKPDYDDTPAGQAKYWKDEFAFARSTLDSWHKEGKKVVDKFLDKRKDSESMEIAEQQSRLNLFYSNIITLQSMLYGSLPKVEVSRTFADADDDVARVGAQIINRILNQDIQDPGDDFTSILHHVLEDRLIPGLGTARVRYQFNSEEIVTPPVIDPNTGMVLAEEVTETKITDEWVETIYVHWQDLLYSPARTASEIRWKAYRSYLNYDELVDRFGEEVAKDIPISSRGPVETKKGSGEKSECLPQAEVWEIWDKSKRKVCWFVEDYPKILDSQDDPLQLDSFFPDPPALVANTTTTKYVPRSDYALSQDLYAEIDKLQTRISILTDACKAIGVYDKNNEGIKRIFNEGIENDLIPVDNWAMFAEKGGLKGVVDWVPIEAIVNTIDVLTRKQAEKIQQLYELTGMSDIMRGSSQPYEAAATSKAKVQFASIRVQRLQDEFARFASDLQSLKMEIIQKHFQPQSIIEQSNIMATPDADLAEQAVELVKNQRAARWRIQIRPESLALADYAQLKADRTEYINSLALFMQSAAPLVQLDKKSVPILLELLKWGLAGFKGSNEIEGVLDRAVNLFKQAAEQPEEEKPDPAMQKIEGELKIKEFEAQSRLQLEQAQMQQDQQKFMQEMERDRQQFVAEMERDQQKFLQEMHQMREKHALELQTLQVTLGVKLQESEAKIEEKAAATALAIRQKQETSNEKEA